MQELMPGAEAIRDWSVALGLFSAIMLAVGIARPLLERRLEKLSSRTTTRVDDAILVAIRATRMWLVTVFAAAVSLRSLEVSEQISRVLGAAATLAIFVQLGLWVTTLWSFWLGNTRATALKTNAAAATSLSAIGMIGEIGLWTVLGLAALDNLGVNITTLIAGLGIGGIAVALAVQNILGDLFASLSIVIDKPFVIGDYVIVEDYMGTIEDVGLKTTRVRSVNGEQIIFSNSDLLKARLRNYKRMYQRRVLFIFGLDYETDAAMLEEIPGMLREIIESHEKVRFDRAHFTKFGDTSLEFEAVYWVLDPDHRLYMDTQQAINLEIKKRFDERDIEFSYPARTEHAPVEAATQRAAAAIEAETRTARREH